MMSELAAEKGPYWSVTIPTYERPTVRETLESVLRQDRGAERMQILVVDNCSPTVDVRAIVDAVGKGRVEYVRNETNIGMVGNLNTCIKRARGTWVHILHDDDIVYPGFYEAMEAAGAAGTHTDGRAIGAAFCRVANIDPNGQNLGETPKERDVAGVFVGFERRCFQGNAVLFPGMVVQRRVYEEMGGFDPSFWYTPDWILWVRIAQKYAVWYEPRTLAGYRRHAGAETSRLFRYGEDISGLAQALDKMVEILPQDLATRQELTGIREHMACVGIGNARGAMERGDFFTGICQAREGLKCSAGPAVLRFLDGGLMQFWDRYVNNAVADLRAYGARPGDPALVAKVRGIRRQMAAQIMEFGPEWARGVWEQMRGLGMQLVQAGLQDEPCLGEEAGFVADLRRGLAEVGKAQDPASKWSQQLNAALLYCQPQELGVPVGAVPEWLLGDYVQAMFRVPRKWRDASGPAAMERALLQLEADVGALARGGAPIWQQVGQFVAGRMAALRKPNA